VENAVDAPDLTTSLVDGSSTISSVSLFDHSCPEVAASTAAHRQPGKNQIHNLKYYFY
jgi:hypothetical protein